MVRRTLAPVFDGFLLPICLRGLQVCWLERALELITRCTVRGYAFFFSVATRTRHNESRALGKKRDLR